MFMMKGFLVEESGFKRSACMKNALVITHKNTVKMVDKNEKDDNYSWQINESSKSEKDSTYQCYIERPFPELQPYRGSQTKGKG